MPKSIAPNGHAFHHREPKWVSVLGQSEWRTVPFGYGRPCARSSQLTGLTRPIWENHTLRREANRPALDERSLTVMAPKPTQEMRLTDFVLPVSLGGWMRETGEVQCDPGQLGVSKSTH